jgi:8-oxo-dGTP pyrophosphatase MutT (NUDIX family)
MIAADLVARIDARLERLLEPPAGPLVALSVDDQPAGLLTPDRARRLALFPAFESRGAALALICAASDRTAVMAHIAAQLAREGALTAWRDERYAVRPSLDAPPLFEIERAAARYFGIRTYAAHVNGLVRLGDTNAMWLARRSATKSIDAGMLDNLVGGGIAAGATIESTVVKESWEEAGLDAATAARATRAAALTIFRQQPDGIQHETIYAHDLWLPVEWRPVNQDGEAVEHRLVPLDDVARILASDTAPDVMTADASLVARDCLARLRWPLACFG